MREKEPVCGGPIGPPGWRSHFAFEAARGALGPNLMVSAGTVMGWESAGHEAPLGPHELHRLFPVEPAAASHRLGWAGLEAARFSGLDAAEFERPPLTHHTLILFTGPPDELDLRYDGVKRHRPPPRGSVAVVPAGTPSRWRWRASRGSLHVYLE